MRKNVFSHLKKILLPTLFLLWFETSFLPVFAHHHDSLSVKTVEFVQNNSQWEKQVLYKAALHGGALFAENDGFTFVLLHSQQLQKFFQGKFDPSMASDGMIDAVAYKLHFLESNPAVEVAGDELIQGYHNYYVGNDPLHWATHVPKYRSVIYHNLYQGIDLKLSQGEMHLKYEFVVAPHTSPDIIQMEYEGVQNLLLSKENLVISTSIMQIIELKPVVYQIDKNGKKVFVDCHYQINKRQLSFEMGEYDESLPLIIDPVLIFSSYSGSTADNWGYTATYDKNGNLYSGGNVFGVGYPTTLGTFQVDFAGGSTDIAISKFDAGGSFLHYSTYLGGSGTEVPHSLVVNDNDELYVLGTTSSADFPVTADAYDTTFNGGTAYTLTSTVHFSSGSDIVIAKFNTNGDRLLGATFMGGTGNDGLNTVSTLRKNYADEARGEIIIDEQSNVYVVSSTQSADFPVSANAFQPQHAGGVQDGCIIKLNHNLSNLIWSSFLGGALEDAAYSVVLGYDNSVYVCGGTNSANFPVTSGVVQPAFGGGTNDGFVAHIHPNGTQILEATFLGKEGYDQSYLVKKDRFDNPHIFGQTNASGNSWVYNAAWSVPNSGQFLIKLTPALDSVIWSTTFGTGRGGLDISPTALLVDLCNNIYMSGWGSPITNGGQGGTSGLPVTSDAFQLTTDNNDYYFICISDDASALVYATYFGSPNAREHVDGGTSRFDNKGRIYQAVCAGCMGYDDFPTTQGAWSQVNNSSNCNIGVIKFDFNLPAVVADFNVPNTVCAPIDLGFNNTSQRISDSTTFFWDFGDGTTSTDENPIHRFTTSGTYIITLIAQDLGSCNFADTITREVVVLSNSNITMDDIAICNGDFIQIGIPPSGNENISYEWQPQTDLSNPFISNPIAAPTTTTTYMLFVSDGICIDTITQVVNVENLFIDAGNNQTICLGHSFNLNPTISGDAVRYYWYDHPQMQNRINSDITDPDLLITPSLTTTYYLIVEGLYCEAMDSITVTVSYVELLPTEDFIVCYQDSIQIYVEPTIQGNYSYQWQPVSTILSGENTQNPLVLTLQNTVYSVTVTNEFGCMAVADVSVIIRQYQANPELVMPTCYGSTNGSIALSVTGGTTPYYYDWSNGGSSSSLSNLGEGIYSVTITDATGCSGVDSFRLIQPTEVEVFLVESQNVLCNQICNGSLTVAATGGYSPYNYQWIHGDVGNVADSLCAGSYTVIVTDAHNCPQSSVFTIADTSDNLLLYEIIPISCFGDCNGAINVQTDFGQFNYQFTWNDSLYQDSIAGLCAGDYHAFAVVDNGCTYDLFLQIDEPQLLEIHNLYTLSPPCYGDTDGALFFSVSGGTEPYTFLVDNIPSDNEVHNLPPGQHAISVIDTNGCRLDTTVSILPADLILITEQHFSPPCPDACAGSIDVSVQGGTIPYRYLWNTGAVTPQLNGLCAGTYTVTVSDRHQCLSQLTVVLTDSSLFPIDIQAWSDEDTLFAGESTTLHSTELQPPFTYQWFPTKGVQNPNAATTIVTPSSTTNYIIIVSDEYGCTQSDTIRIFVKEIICDEPYVFIPNAFSPNQDGKNDVLFVRGEVIESIKLEIFDRWGEKVFQSMSLEEGWNGTFRGKDCQQGVYDYYLEVRCMGQQQFFKKGNVTLLR